MELLDCIMKRRSVRKYKDTPLPQEIIEKIIDYAKFYPSWANTKIVRYHCVVNKELKNQIALSTDFNSGYINNAPALFVITAVKGRCGTDRNGGIYYHTPKEWMMLDSGIAIQNLCLVAHDFGVSTLIMGVFNAPKIIELLDIPEEEQLIAIVAAGYSDETPPTPRRKETADILRII